MPRRHVVISSQRSSILLSTPSLFVDPSFCLSTKNYFLLSVILHNVFHAWAAAVVNARGEQRPKRRNTQEAHAHTHIHTPHTDTHRHTRTHIHTPHTQTHTHTHIHTYYTCPLSVPYMLCATLVARNSGCVKRRRASCCLERLLWFYFIFLKISFFRLGDELLGAQPNAEPTVLRGYQLLFARRVLAVRKGQNQCCDSNPTWILDS